MDIRFFLFLTPGLITFITLCNSTEINECFQNSHDCDSNANCTNTDGSYQCTCNLGYSGNGTSCRGNSIWQDRLKKMQCFTMHYIHVELSGTFLSPMQCFLLRVIFNVVLFRNAILIFVKLFDNSFERSQCIANNPYLP